MAHTNADVTLLMQPGSSSSSGNSSGNSSGSSYNACELQPLCDASMVLKKLLRVLAAAARKTWHVHRVLLHLSCQHKPLPDTHCLCFPTLQRLFHALCWPCHKRQHTLRCQAFSS
jgi:hypothetical protein